MIFTEQDAERFWSKVDKSGDCWLWTGAKNSSGYGIFFLGGKNAYAHRISFLAYIGNLNPGMMACHKCDVRTCVRPTHLFQGTHADNMEDRQRKGRTAVGDMCGSIKHPERLPRGANHWSRRMPFKVKRGENNNKAKLSESDVISIRSDYELGILSSPKLARKWNMDKSSICDIINRKTWKHVK